jgi:hypothetical protein
MSPRGLSLVLGLSFAFLAQAAFADLLPPPGQRERALANQIGRAGFACPAVKALDTPDDATSDQYGKKGLVASIVSCTNGSRYLVANPKRQAPGEPLATPVVIPWS